MYLVAYKLLPIVFLVRLLAEHISLLCSHPIPVMNFALSGLPYLLLGNWISKNICKILKFATFARLSIGMLIGMIIILLNTFNVFSNCIFELGYVGVFMIAVTFLIYAQKYPQEKIINVLGIVGEQYSLFVYIMHMMIGNIIYIICEMKGWFVDSDWIKPIIVVLVSITGAIIWNGLVNLIHKNKRKI